MSKSDIFRKKRRENRKKKCICCFFFFRFIINPFFRIYRGQTWFTQRIFNLINGFSYLLVILIEHDGSEYQNLEASPFLPRLSNRPTEVYPVVDNLDELEGIDFGELIEDLFNKDFLNFDLIDFENFTDF